MICVVDPKPFHVYMDPASILACNLFPNRENLHKNFCIQQKKVHLLQGLQTKRRLTFFKKGIQAILRIH
jgi:hypothetical protein